MNTSEDISTALPKTIAITQPTFAPWSGLFEMIDRVDAFVFLDDVQYPRKEWLHRNRIRSSKKDGWEWISVSVRRGGALEQLILETRINYDSPWVAKVCERMEAMYSKSSYWSTLGVELVELLRTEYESIAELNIALITWGVASLGIKTQLIRSSSLGVPGRREEKLIGILRSQGAGAYLANNGSAVYLDEGMFLSDGIAVGFQNYTPRPYSGYVPDALPPLSFVDSLLVCGPASALDILRAGRPQEWQRSFKRPES